MFSTETRQLSVGPFRAAMPTLSVIAAILLALVPLGLPGSIIAPPSLALVFVYLWTLRRPSLLPHWTVFLCGVFQDLVWAGPLGLWTLVFLSVHVFTLTQRAVLQESDLTFVWLAFGFIAVGAGVMAWIVATAFYSAPMPILPILSQTVLTILVLPLVNRIMPWLERRIGPGGR